MIGNQKPRSKCPISESIFSPDVASHSDTISDKSKTEAIIHLDPPSPDPSELHDRKSRLPILLCMLFLRPLSRPTRLVCGEWKEESCHVALVINPGTVSRAGDPHLAGMSRFS